MEERRREPRIPTDLVVEVWGRNQSGALFVQAAHARNISFSGALLDGIDHEVRPGDIVGIKHKDRQAKFCVVWAMEMGSPARFRIAVHRLNGQACPWQEELSLSAKR